MAGDPGRKDLMAQAGLGVESGLCQPGPGELRASRVIVVTRTPAGIVRSLDRRGIALVSRVDQGRSDRDAEDRGTQGSCRHSPRGVTRGDDQRAQDLSKAGSSGFMPTIHTI